MDRRLVQAAFFVAIAGMLTACAGGISRQALSQVTYSGAFSDVLKNPAGYQGQTVIWGGRVIKIENENGGTQIVALQQDLDGDYRPANSDQSQGRFLIRSSQFLDPVLYPPGTLFTVVGRLQGAENRLIGEMTYRYPVIDIVEIQRWDPQRRSSPRVHIGIGVSGRF